MEKYSILIVFFTLLTICCNTGCNKKSEFFKHLATVDSLFSAEQDSLAAIKFNEISQPKDSTEDLAYYNFIHARLSCRNWEKT